MSNDSAKAALVTGGAKRVGRAIALDLARAGYDIAVHYRTSDQEAQQLVEEIRGMRRNGVTIQGDLAEPKSWPRIVSDAIDSFGRLDVLVNNASVFPTDDSDRLASFDHRQWADTLRVNLTAPVGLCHHAAAYLKKSKGCVINLLDISVERPWPGHLAYCASKAGLAAVTQALARGLAPEVRVCGVAPGIAIFPEDYDQALRDRLVDRVPMKRAGTPEEIAAAVRFLVADAGYVTGETIRVDGGRHLR